MLNALGWLPSLLGVYVGCQNCVPKLSALPSPTNFARGCACACVDVMTEVCRDVRGQEVFWHAVQHGGKTKMHCKNRIKVLESVWYATELYKVGAKTI